LFTTTGLSQNWLRDKWFRCGFVVMALFMAPAMLFMAVGCGMVKDISSESVGPKEISITADLLEKAGLREQWHIPNLLIGRGDQIKRIFYHNSKLFVLDNHNKLYALAGLDGNPLWSESLCDPHSSCSEPEFYKDRILFVAGNTIVEVSEKDRKITMRIPLKFPATTTAARDDDFVFVGSRDNRFYCLEIANAAVKKWHSVQPAQPVGSVKVVGDKVFFVCKDGVLYVCRTDRRKEIWHVSTADQTPGVVVDNNRCYLPSTDTALYCYDADSGDKIWKYLAGGKLTSVPVLTKKFVYQAVGQKSLLCLERNPVDKNGYLKWELPNGAQLLAENGPVSYAITHDDELTLMDNVNGKRQLSFYVANVDLCPTNTEDNTIFLANRNGSIIALTPKK